MSEIFDISDRIRVLPVVHGSGDFAQEARRVLLAEHFDCVAVPLPPSVRRPVLAAVGELPHVSLVTLREGVDEEAPIGWVIEEEDDEDGDGDGEHREAGTLDQDAEPPGASGEAGGIEDPEETGTEIEAVSYVPIDPCQAVIAALRVALEERLQTAFIDLEVEHYRPDPALTPDPYALKRMPLERYAAAMLPYFQPPPPGSQRDARIRRMAFELHRLELEHERVLALVAIQDWPWVRDAYRRRAPYPEPVRPAEAPRTYSVRPATLYFVLGELPFVTHLYENRRRAFRRDDHLSIDGVKELLLEARARWLREREPERHWVTPQLLKTMLHYMRNLTLLDRRLSPDLYTIAVAAKQAAGDDFATFVVDTARHYPEQRPRSPFATASCGPELAELGDSGIFWLKSRLPGPPQSWRQLSLKPQPRPHRSRLWQVLWDPYGQCSWPPEDERIESFNTHVRDQARALLGSDLARSEKFQSSIKDGLDLRETLRNWHSGELYVQEIPPSRGNVEVVVFLFDSPPDPQVYSWRSTWHAEHASESTLAFYATPFIENMIGPGIGLSKYGGCLFLYPPRLIHDVWSDPGLERARSIEDRLVAAALVHSRERNVVLVAPRPPRNHWRLLARRLRKHLVYIPLARFSGQTVERLRHFHVLNGQDVRSYAARFIREF